MTDEIYVKVLGTRGSVPVLLKKTEKYGGNTSCIYVRCGERSIILDAGTGILKLDSEEITGKKLDILISHCHLDHIIGLPVYEPLFYREYNVNIYGPSGADMGIKDRIERLMSPPLWPVGLNTFLSKPKFVDVHGGDTFYIDEIKISTINLRHPGGSIGYSIEYGGRKLTYMLDMENPDTDEHILEFVKNSDLIISDGQYTEEEYLSKTGWGHSTHDRAARIGMLCNAGKLLITHHAPERSDEELDYLTKGVQQICRQAEFAREGMEFSFPIVI